MLWWIVGGVLLLVIFAAMIAVWRSSRSFGVADMMEVGSRLAVIQKNAFGAAGGGSGGGVRPPTSAMIAQQVFVTSRGLSVAYTVEREGETFCHHLSCQAPGRSRKFLTQATLFAMMLVSKQLEESHLSGDDGPRFDVGESETGTQHVAFALTAKQQERLAAVLFAD